MYHWILNKYGMLSWAELLCTWQSASPCWQWDSLGLMTRF